jgi:hypothetical protein
MRTVTRAVLSGLILLVGGLAAVAYATNYSLWINGRTGGGTEGNYADFTYWGSSSVDAGVNKKSVNWDGYNHVADKNYLVRNALDCYCTGSNWCYVAAHSAGNMMIGYALSMYGGSTRNVKTPSPASDGTCSNASSGATQTGWNIKFVDVAAGAAGGSELSDVGSWAVSEPLVQDLKTTTARALYDHNTTRSIWFYMYAGAKGPLYSGILPGQDDEAVAYHSSGGVSGTSGRSLCNPSDWLCNDLTMGTAANEGGSTKWSYHSVVFRDDNEAYNHYTNSSWGGVVGLVRTHMVNNAQ